MGKKSARGMSQKRKTHNQLFTAIKKREYTKAIEYLQERPALSSYPPGKRGGLEHPLFVAVSTLDVDATEVPADLLSLLKVLLDLCKSNMPIILDMRIIMEQLNLDSVGVVDFFRYCIFGGYVSLVPFLKEQGIQDKPEERDTMSCPDCERNILLYIGSSLLYAQDKTLIEKRINMIIVLIKNGYGSLDQPIKYLCGEKNYHQNVMNGILKIGIGTRYAFRIEGISDRLPSITSAEQQASAVLMLLHKLESNSIEFSYDFLFCYPVDKTFKECLKNIFLVDKVLFLPDNVLFLFGSKDLAKHLLSRLPQTALEVVTQRSQLLRFAAEASSNPESRYARIYYEALYEFLGHDAFVQMYEEKVGYRASQPLAILVVLAMIYPEDMPSILKGIAPMVDPYKCIGEVITVQLPNRAKPIALRNILGLAIATGSFSAIQRFTKNEFLNFLPLLQVSDKRCSNNLFFHGSLLNSLFKNVRGKQRQALVKYLASTLLLDISGMLKLKQALREALSASNLVNFSRLVSWYFYMPNNFLPDFLEEVEELQGSFVLELCSEGSPAIYLTLLVDPDSDYMPLQLGFRNYKAINLILEAIYARNNIISMKKLSEHQRFWQAIEQTFEDSGYWPLDYSFIQGNYTEPYRPELVCQYFKECFQEKINIKFDNLEQTYHLLLKPEQFAYVEEIRNLLRDLLYDHVEIFEGSNVNVISVKFRPTLSFKMPFKDVNYDEVYRLKSIGSGDVPEVFSRCKNEIAQLTQRSDVLPRDNYTSVDYVAQQRSKWLATQEDRVALVDKWLVEDEGSVYLSKLQQKLVKLIQVVRNADIDTRGGELLELMRESDLNFNQSCVKYKNHMISRYRKQKAVVISEHAVTKEVEPDPEIPLRAMTVAKPKTNVSKQASLFKPANPLSARPKQEIKIAMECYQREELLAIAAPLAGYLKKDHTPRVGAALLLRISFWADSLDKMKVIICKGLKQDLRQIRHILAHQILSLENDYQRLCEISSIIICKKLSLEQKIKKLISEPFSTLDTIYDHQLAKSSSTTEWCERLQATLKELSEVPLTDASDDLESDYAASLIRKANEFSRYIANSREQVEMTSSPEQRKLMSCIRLLRNYMRHECIMSLSEMKEVIKLTTDAIKQAPDVELETPLQKPEEGEPVYGRNIRPG